MIPQHIIDSIKDYLQRLLNLHETLSNGDDNDNQIYLSLAENDDELEDIKELCEETDYYYEERAKLKASKMKAYRYLEHRAVELYVEENPDATEEDRDKFLDDIRSVLDRVIERNANTFYAETREDNFDDSEQAEMFLKEIEERLKAGENVILKDVENTDGKEAEA